jgi:uncharacterized phage protein gp47/JayE
LSDIQIKSFNQILGGMVRKIVAETPLSDVNPGSVFLSLLEACASQDFDNNVAILNILELLNVDSIRNNDLDNKAADLGLTRNTAKVASGTISILNTNISKQSSSLYSLKSVPISGQTSLFVNSTAGWTISGSLYIGRGTNSFEGPIPYTNITVFSTYSQITLGAALQKDHLASDTVINAQGQPDRVVPAGIVIKIPANSQNPDILYATIRDAVIPAGEDHIDGVLVAAQVAGSQGNALIGTIRQFNTAPFAGATVSNLIAFSTGSDIETDVQLRNRIKAYASSLARGTSPAILSVIVGLSDPDENKRIASAILSQPVAVNEPSILYIDDGSGFQPSQAGQTVDVLVARANGSEEFLQLANYPLPRAQLINDASGPLVFLDQMFLRIAVDGIEETIVFTTSDFSNISVASLPEIVSAINAKATLFKAQLTNDSANILLFTVDSGAEIIQVIPIRSSDTESLYANNLLNFPIKEASYIALFQNSTRLHQRERIATVETIPFALWNLFIPGDLLVSVDGTPVQDQSFSLADFPSIPSFTALTLDSWVEAFNSKFAGITAAATPNQTMRISSNKRGAGASIEVFGGIYREQMFSSNVTFATGQDSQFQINRSNGNIRVLTDIVDGDVISAGIADAKGFVVSTITTSGTYGLDTDVAGRQAQMIICADSTFCDKISVNLDIDSSLIFSDRSSSVMRIMADNIEAFRNVQPGHFVYVVYRSVGSSWVNTNNSGLFKVISRGSHLSASSDTYIEVWNNHITEETVTVADVADFAVFHTDVYPQLWTSSYLDNPTAATLDDLVQSINTALLGVNATIFRTNSVKITSTTEDGGSIALPVSSGNISVVFLATNEAQSNNSPLIANKVSTKDMLGFIKMQPIISQNSYMGRAKYPAIYTDLSSSVDPDVYPYSDAYAEVITSALLTNANVDLSDQLLFTRGDNEGLLRSIKAKPADTVVGTQQGLPRTLLDYTRAAWGINANDRVQIFTSLQMAQDDNIVIVMDQDAIIKTISIPAARTGQINSGSSSSTFIPTSSEFSANDIDNESGVDFGTVNVWGTDINDTNFSDYSVLMRARNWYASGGTGSILGKFIVRFTEFGANGNKCRFNIEYPANPNLDNSTVLTDTPSWNKLSYKFGSGAARATGIPNGTTVVVTGPYVSSTINFPGGASGSGNYWDFAFSAGDFSAVLVGDVISCISGSGFPIAFLGQYGIKNKSGNTIRLYSQTASVTSLTITTPSLISIFPLTKTTVADIITKTNQSNIVVAAAVSAPSASITTSTFEDQYTYTTNATALGNGHNPGTSSLQGFINLYDGTIDVKSFSNSNPNFVLKNTLVLPATGVSASIYRMDTAPNEDGVPLDEALGEYFKLVPTTVKNIQHHFTQKALSQLPIVADVSIADNGKRVQIVSKELGGGGAIEILGGQVNSAQTSIIGQSVISSDTTGSYLLSTIAAFPNTYALGDTVKITNQHGVARATQFASSSTLDVTALTSGRAEYYWNPIVTNFQTATTFIITDVSSSYTDYAGAPLSAGIVWRWTHSIGYSETISLVVPGHQVIALNCSGWSNTNQAKLPGDGSTVGLPIIAVNDTAHTFDVVNPFGKAMSITAVGDSGTVKICPVPRNRWYLAHSAPTSISSITRTSNVVTVQTTTSHNMNTNDSVVISNSLGAVVNGPYNPITVTGPQTYTFANAGADLIELNVGATSTPTTATATTYILHKLGANNLIRISSTSGDSPRFADCGVAVDDYLVIQGTTFNSSNNGVHRVVAVDNTSVVVEHEGAVEDRNRLTPFNYNSISVVWTANSNILQGSAGSFKNLATGTWVKKVEDGDSYYLQVTGNDTSGNYTTATKVYLGQLYTGVTGSALGISYNMISGYDAGVSLKNADDLLFYEGDSAFKTDTLNVQAVTTSTWFNPRNTGQFQIIEIGNKPSDCLPFVRVNSPVAVSETNRNLSATPQGFYIVENDLYKYSTYRTVTNSTTSSTDSLQRHVYMLPDARAYKITAANDSIMSHAGKLGYDLITSVGTDGYLFYTGLLRRAQRTVDGFAPDPSTFAERRAVGSRIEILPPLIKNISLVITITTKDGSTIQDVSNNIKSSIIDYVNSLGVGVDVILSAIIATIMKVKGVAAATFNTPVPSQERITIAANEKALIFADAIGII